MLYALNLARVRMGDDQRTTLMVRNIPNKYNQKMLLATIEDRLGLGLGLGLGLANRNRNPNRNPNPNPNPDQARGQVRPALPAHRL